MANADPTSEMNSPSSSFSIQVVPSTTFHEVDIEELSGCIHAWQLWEEINLFLNSHAKAKSRQLGLQLPSIAHESSSIIDYFNHIKVLVDALVAIGSPISSSEHIDYILDELNEEFQPVITSVERQLDQPMIHALESFLLTFEARLEKNRNKSILDALSANLAVAPNRSPSPAPVSLQYEVCPSYPSSYMSYRPDFANHHGSRGGRRGDYRGGRGGRFYLKPPPSYCDYCNCFGHDVSYCYYAPYNYVQNSSGSKTWGQGMHVILNSPKCIE